MRFRSPRIRFTMVSLACLVAVLLCLSFAQTALAQPKSSKVVFIGGSTVTTDGSSFDAANVVMNGGYFPVEGAVGTVGDFSEFTFAPMTAADVSADSLKAYDTAVLNMAASGMWVDDGLGGTTFALNASEKQAIVDWVAAGGKLIIYDSEMEFGGTGLDYSWLPYSFSTNNPGAMGASGVLTIVEENVLSSNSSLKPAFVDAAYLSDMTDAVGDMNVMTTRDSNWYIDMAGTNANNASGPVHCYARYGNGLMIYNGLDQDVQPDIGSSEAGLTKIWYLELACAFNLTPITDLPSGQTATGITLTPASATLPVGSSYTATATVTDVLGHSVVATQVTIEVTSGPDAGVSITGMTDANGQLALTFTGLSVGTDSIVASYVPLGGTTPVKSNGVTVQFVTGADTRTLSYVAGTGGSIDGSATQVVAVGSDGTTVTALPNTGYHFVKWSDNVMTAERRDMDVMSDVGVTAMFAIDTHTVTYLAGPGGSIDGSATQMVDYGSDCTSVTAVPAAGYHFVKWSDNVMTAERRDIDVIADLTVTATFAANPPAPLIATSLTKPIVEPRSPRHRRTSTFTTWATPKGAAVSGTTTLSLWHWETKTVKKVVRGKTKKVKVKYWRLRKTLTMSGNSSGRLSVSYKLPYSGKWKMSAAYSGSPIYKPCTSPSRTFPAK